MQKSFQTDFLSMGDLRLLRCCSLHGLTVPNRHWWSQTLPLGLGTANILQRLL